MMQHVLDSMSYLYIYIYIRLDSHACSMLWLPG